MAYNPRATSHDPSWKWHMQRHSGLRLCPTNCRSVTNSQSGRYGNDLVCQHIAEAVLLMYSAAGLPSGRKPDTRFPDHSKHKVVCTGCLWPLMHPGFTPRLPPRCTYMLHAYMRLCLCFEKLHGSWPSQEEETKDELEDELGLPV
jgi:hypothetical protein